MFMKNSIYMITYGIISTEKLPHSEILTETGINHLMFTARFRKNFHRK